MIYVFFFSFFVAPMAIYTALYITLAARHQTCTSRSFITRTRWWFSSNTTAAHQDNVKRPSLLSAESISVIEEHIMSRSHLLKICPGQDYKPVKAEFDLPSHLGDIKPGLLFWNKGLGVPGRIYVPRLRLFCSSVFLVHLLSERPMNQAPWILSHLTQYFCKFFLVSPC